MFKLEFDLSIPSPFCFTLVFVFLLRQFSLSISQTLPVCPPSSCQRGPLMLLLTSTQTSSRTFFWSSTRFGSSSDGSFLAGSVKLSPQSFVVWLPSFHCGLQARFFLLQSVIFFLPGFIPLRKFSLFFCSAGFWSVRFSERLSFFLLRFRISLSPCLCLCLCPGLCWVCMESVLLLIEIRDLSAEASFGTQLQIWPSAVAAGSGHYFWYSLLLSPRDVLSLPQRLKLSCWTSGFCGFGHLPSFPSGGGDYVAACS